MVRRLKVIAKAPQKGNSSSSSNQDNSSSRITSRSNNYHPKLILLGLLSVWFLCSSTFITNRYYKKYFFFEFGNSIIVDDIFQPSVAVVNNNTNHTNAAATLAITQSTKTTTSNSTSSTTKSPTTSSTSSTSNKTTARVCLMYKPLVDDGQFYDLEEWIDYQFAIGFTSVRIFNYSPNFDLKDYNKTKHNNHIIGGPENVESSIVISHLNDVELNKIRVGKRKDMSPQNIAYELCLLESIKENIDWVAPLDGDEFLVLHKHTSVIEFMDDVCLRHDDPKCGQISITMRVFGHSNLTKYEPTIPITKRFQYYVDENIPPSSGDKKVVSYAKELSTYIKAIVNPKVVKDTSKWFHAFPLLEGWKSYTPDGKLQPSHNGWKKMFNYHIGKGKHIAQLNHYTFKSAEEEYLKQCLRGDGISGITMNDFSEKCSKHKLAINANTNNSSITSTTTTSTNNNNNDKYKNQFNRKYSDDPDNAGQHYDNTAWTILKTRIPSKYQKYD